MGCHLDVVARPHPLIHTGENVEIRLDDWLPALERASTRNGWTEEERLIQLAGHLRDRALQEWNLLEDVDKKTYADATQALRSRLDPGGRALAAQDFRHTVQGEAESAADFIRRLERTFRIAYGRDGMSGETRDILLHGQLQEGLKYDIMKAPSVSGAQTYKQLCLAAKNEEKRLAELKKRQHYSTPQATTPNPAQGGDKKCYVCNKAGHLARDCKASKSESRGRPVSTSTKPANTRSVQTHQGAETSVTSPGGLNPMDFLFSDSSDSDDGGEVRAVRVDDGGSRPRCVRLQIQGVPVVGILDSGSDITIMGGALFKKVATAAKLKRKGLKQSDKVPRTYTHKPFILDGRMDLEVSFGNTTMMTPIYMKMDARDQLLLSEGVCRQLGIISYHPEVEIWRGGRKQPPQLRKSNEATVPTVRVRMLQSPQRDRISYQVSTRSSRSSAARARRRSRSSFIKRGE